MAGMKDITIAVPFVRSATEGARRAGFDVNRILKSSGISPHLLERPRARVALDDFVRLIQQLMRLMDDECLGLMAHPQRLGTFELITRSTLHEKDLLAAMRCFARSANLLTSELFHFVEVDEHHVTFGLRRQQRPQTAARYLIESSIMTAHRYFCWLGHTRIPLQRVDLDYSAPEWAEEYRHLFFGAPVHFDSRDIALVMKRAALEVPVRQDLASLTAYIQRAPRDLFTPVHNTSTSHAARLVILKHFEQGRGMPRASDVAAALNLSPQTFWRRLHQEGADFTQVKTRARRDVAISLLSESGYSIEQIAETVGYSESSALIRAFKEWTGVTPLRYRKL